MRRRPVKREATPRHDGNRWNENNGRGFKPKPVPTVARSDRIAGFFVDVDVA